ncbi:MAG: alkaline phosphatase D family protein [Chloroflexota bacterium]
MADQPNIILGPIIGGLSHRGVILWARADGPSTLYAWLASDENLSDAKQMGKAELTDATGFAGAIPIDGLEAERVYYFALSLDTESKPPDDAFESFRTFPPPGKAVSFRFAFGSCFRPEHRLPGRAFRHMLRNQPNLDFMILEGDQIYADEWKHNGLGYVALTVDDYRAVYLHTWSNSYFRELLARTPVFMTLDDHEVDNDWHWHDREHTIADIPAYTRFTRLVNGLSKEERRLTAQRVQDALQVYREHQGMHAPAFSLPQRQNNGSLRFVADDAGSLAYSFYFGAAAFYVMDTRTQRLRNRQEQIVLGDAQWRAFEAWLLAVKDDFPLKFIVTSSAVLFEFWGDIVKDRWPGFPEERERLLRLLADNEISGVYFLAGDLHEAHAVSAELCGPDGHTLPIWEFSSTPFEQKTNYVARLLKRKTHSSAVCNSKIYYSIDRINYGIVEVEFGAGQTEVRFDLFYNERGRWKVRKVKTRL